ncbi:MAG: NADH-quinone oxidoreductase subunit NuoB [Coriobacteriales bacterium]|jgi:ech hydrogenase subunit C
MSVKDTSKKGASYVKKSPWIIHYDAASCNGCDIEVLASLTPLYDVERFGIINTGNPRHADIFLVTGSVNEQAKPVIEQIYSQMVEPKVVIACGICACSGGVFKTCYNTMGGIDQVIPVDVYVPGCAVRPEALIDGVVRALDILEQKRAAMDAGLPVPTPEVKLGVETPRVLHTQDDPDESGTPIEPAAQGGEGAKR